MEQRKYQSEAKSFQRTYEELKLFKEVLLTGDKPGFQRTYEELKLRQANEGRKEKPQFLAYL